MIAVEVFGRRPDHDPSRDSIVRTEAGRLRARLAEYYLGEGKDDEIVIELPKGGYTPAFHRRETKPESTVLEGPARRRNPADGSGLSLLRPVCSSQSDS